MSFGIILLTEISNQCMELLSGVCESVTGAFCFAQIGKKKFSTLCSQDREAMFTKDRFRGKAKVKNYGSIENSDFNPSGKEARNE